MRFIDLYEKMYNVLEHSMNVLIEVQKSVCYIRVFECNTIELLSPYGIF